MEDDTTRVCSNCQHALQTTDKFCPECGEHVPAVEVVPEDDPTPETVEPVASKSRRPLFIGAAVAAIGLIIAGAAWWGLTQNSEAKEQ